MNVRKSASLTASVCSLCITASLVTAPPQAAAAALPATQHRTVSVVDQPYALTASTQQIIEDLLVVAGIPFQNFYTTLNTLGGVTVFVTNTNKALGAVYTGQWDQIPTYLQAAWDDQTKAIQKIIALPQTLIDYDTKAIQNLLASLGAGGPTPAPLAATAGASAALAATAAASPEDIFKDALVVAGIPFQNFYTTLNTLGGVTVFVTNTNKALGAVYTGQWDQIPTYLQAAWDDQTKAIQKIIALPQTLIDYDTKAIQNLLASLGAGGPTPTPLAATAGAPAALAATAAASPEDIFKDALVVAGIPFQNFYTTLNTLGGVTVFVTNTNKALGAVYTGQWDQIPTYLQAAWDDQTKAIQKIIALPQTLIDYDTKAIQNLLANFTSEPPTATPYASNSRIQTLALESAAPQEEKAVSGNAAVETPEIKGAAEPKAVGAPKTSEAEDLVAKDGDGTHTETPTDKPAAVDTDKESDGETGASGPGKRAVFGKHARRGEAPNSTPSAAAGASATGSTLGRHRKPEGKTAGPSAPSTGGSATAGS